MLWRYLYATVSREFTELMSVAMVKEYRTAFAMLFQIYFWQIQSVIIQSEL